MFKSSMKEEDIKALVNAVKKEFQQEITSLNERIQHLEQQNLNLNTFIQHHFERLEHKTDENHQYILNTWNPFMQSTIEGVKNDLIQAMDNNKKDDNELSKRVDTLAIQVSDLNKAVFDEGFVNIVYSISNTHKITFIPIKKNIEVFDLLDIDMYFYISDINHGLSNNGCSNNIIINYLNLFPKLKRINLTKMLNKNGFSSDSSVGFIWYINFKVFGNSDNYIEINNDSYYATINRQPDFKNSADTERNKQIDRLKKYIKTNFPHIEII